jgi:CheY-like chemotaxis protein
MSEKLKILVLDDSAFVLDVVRQTLAEEGYQVLTAGSLADFDRELAKGQPHLILVDIKMPEISGERVCQVLKQRLETQSIPIVLFSTLEERKLAVLAARAGADGYVSKNAGLDEIVRQIREITDNIVF